MNYVKAPTSVTINISNCGKTYEISKVIPTNVKIKQEDIEQLYFTLEDMIKTLTKQMEESNA